ncbi:MAG TPA: 3'-5' exonuclease [Candidatus Baltobacteraceae bacterium]|nr:3'-5' exonuclease [Candidatus Baltobacteraceae bacterium]
MSTFITGAAGTGKTAELIRRALAAAQAGPVLITSTSQAALDMLRERVQHPNACVRELHAVALECLADAEEIDDVRAAMLFADAARPLLTLEWREIIEAEVDPEVPGLRAPDRFLDAAFRLFCKLRDARISPEQFLESALRGAMQFYAKPPNLAHPDLLYYTKDSHRDSLHADAAELARQYKREIDLAKILSKLYRSYLDHPVRQGCLTPRDVIAQAADVLQNDARTAQRMRERYPSLFVDEAQELTVGELQLLQAVYGANLDGATLAGDAESATSTFRGARPDRVFALAGERITMEEQHRSPFAVDVACRHLLGAPGASPVSTDPRIGLTLFRASTRRAEAQFIAEHVVDLLSAGALHDDIAVIFRSVRDIRPYRDALLDRNVRVQVAGDLNLFIEPEALDALAILWAVHDPFRHDYLLRVLSGPALALSDASIYALCSEPPDAQTLLFEETAAEENAARAGHWDVRRDVRLAWNVLRGDQDERLSDLARERLRELRGKIARWRDLLPCTDLPRFVRLVWSEGLAAAGTAGGARAAYQQQTLARVMRRLERFTDDHPSASLAEFLDYAQARMESDFEACEVNESAGAVRMLSIGAARGREFEHVIIPRARAGSFPRWYAPDAFLYSPSLGMIAKENVGDARAARTAKFTYYMFRTKAREAYNKEERRAFVYAMRRAKTSVLVTACERATRGISAPEFLAELQAARLPGTVDISDRWRPTRAVYAG